MQSKQSWDPRWEEKGEEREQEMRSTGMCLTSELMGVKHWGLCIRMQSKQSTLGGEGEVGEQEMRTTGMRVTS